HNVVRIVTAPSRNPVPTESDNLSKPEKDAFRKIAEALGARLSEDAPSIDAEESDGANPNTAEAQPDTDNRTQTELASDDTQEPHGSPSHTLSDSAEPASGAIDPRILDRLPIGVAIVHLRDVLYCNDTMLELLGYQSISELSDAGGLEAIFAEPEEWPDTDEETQETDQSVCVRMKNGNLKRVDARLHTVPWQGGNGLMISLHELTDQNLPVQTEQPTVEFEEISEETVRVAELESILETATDGIIIMTADGIVQAVNRSAEALFGRNSEELIGGELAACLAPESRRSIRDYIGGLTQNGVASLLNDGREVIGIAEGGGMIPLFMTIGRINTEGDDIKLCAVLRDITQWKKAEEELTSASREAELASSQKSDFLAKISHEIRTPLNAIIGFSEVMMEERFGPIGNERYREYLLDIHNSGAHIMSLINDLLDLSKIEAGKLELTFESVSVNEIIRECVALMQPQANRDRIIIRASLPTSTPNVVADARSLRQIILNLLSNAIKFNNPGGQVIISTVLESNGELFIRVRDTGIGMNKKDLKLALEPFRQLHTARLGGGTGLGLPLTKALAEANRAMFNLESETGEGTLVEIAFPAQRVLVQ
ncbi:MAG: PAS domain-containing sensor histidine kinase, partial [Stappiaceae bacterium]